MHAHKHTAPYPLLAGLPDIQGLQALLGDEGGHGVATGMN
jgi:hypothetical protein